MRWSMLPVSIGAHVIGGVALLIVPLTAEVAPPIPAPLHTLLVTTKVSPVPPPVMPSAAAPRAAPATSITIPSTIADERDAPPETAGPVTPGVPVDGPGTSTAIVLPAGSPIVVPPPPQPPAPSVSGPVRAGQGVRVPKKVFDVAPMYPEIARTARIDGVVILEAVINERGLVERVKVLRSVPLLDAAAVDAVKEWRYTPTLLNGVPVSVLMTITITFTLHD